MTKKFLRGKSKQQGWAASSVERQSDKPPEFYVPIMSKAATEEAEPTTADVKPTTADVIPMTPDAKPMMKPMTADLPAPTATTAKKDKGLILEKISRGGPP